jgi:hypothetical protein
MTQPTFKYVWLDFDALRRGLLTDREHDARPLTHDLCGLADRTL